MIPDTERVVRELERAAAQQKRKDRHQAQVDLWTSVIALWLLIAGPMLLHQGLIGKFSILTSVVYTVCGVVFLYVGIFVLLDILVRKAKKRYERKTQ